SPRAGVADGSRGQGTAARRRRARCPHPAACPVLFALSPFRAVAMRRGPRGPLGDVASRSPALRKVGRPSPPALSYPVEGKNRRRSPRHPGRRMEVSFMASATLGGTLRHLRELFDDGMALGFGDGQLLARYAATRDEAAFAALVARHGPMVLSTCRAV